MAVNLQRSSMLAIRTKDGIDDTWKQILADMVVTFDKLEVRGDATAFHWTLTGTNTGPGGTGNRVRISGYELWKIGNDGRIAESKGYFDAADYERQLNQK